MEQEQKEGGFAAPESYRYFERILQCKDLTAIQVAELAAFNRTVFSRWRTGQTRPTLRRLRKILETCEMGMSPQECEKLVRMLEKERKERKQKASRISKSKNREAEMGVTGAWREIEPRVDIVVNGRVVLTMKCDDENTAVDIRDKFWGLFEIGGEPFLNDQPATVAARIVCCTEVQCSEEVSGNAPEEEPSSEGSPEEDCDTWIHTDMN